MPSEKSKGPGAPPAVAVVPDAKRSAKARSRYPTWESLRWLFLFRLLMVVALVLIFSPAANDPLIAREIGRAHV